MQNTNTFYFALGSNLGDRHKNLRTALQALPARGIEVLKVSTFIETAPVGGPPGQGQYVNAVAHAKTKLNPHQVLQVFLQVEKELGRERVKDERNTPRTLDLDLLLFEDQILHDAELTLPHPRLHEREFVLGPLKEIAPDLWHPVLKKRIHEIHP